MYKPGYQLPGGFGGGLPSLGKGGPRLPGSNPQPPATLPTETATTQPPQQGGFTPMPIVDYQPPQQSPVTQRPGMGKGAPGVIGYGPDDRPIYDPNYRGPSGPQFPPMNSIGFPGQYPQPPMRNPYFGGRFGGGFGGGFGGMPFFGGIGGFMPRFGFRNPFFGGGRFNNPYSNIFRNTTPFMPEPYPDMRRGFNDQYRRSQGDAIEADLVRRGVPVQPRDYTLEPQNPFGSRPSRGMPSGIGGLLSALGPRSMV